LGTQKARAWLPADSPDHLIRRYTVAPLTCMSGRWPARMFLSSAQQLSAFGVTVRPKSGQAPNIAAHFGRLSASLWAVANIRVSKLLADNATPGTVIDPAGGWT
jgi:hypothetical protein